MMSVYDGTYEIFVSRSSTRHVIGVPVGFQRSRLHGSRITALCDFSSKVEDLLPLSAGSQDCEFCLKELEERRRQQSNADAA